MATSAGKPPRRDMRKLLETWRNEKGRTPMKRLSYVHDYATPDGTVIHVHPVVHSPHLLQSLSHARKTNATPAAAISAKKPAFHLSSKKFGNQRSHWENQENVQPSIKAMLKAQYGAVSATKPSGRSTVKRRCSAYGKSCANDQKPRTACTDLRKGSLARTVFSGENKPILKPTQSSRKAGVDNGSFRRALKEQFQRDIDDTLEEICCDKVDQVCEPLVGNFHSMMRGGNSDANVQGLVCIMDGAGDGNQLARQLDFDSESLPVDCRKHESGCSWRTDNSAGSIHDITGSDNGYQCTSKDSPEVTSYSPPVVHTRPTPTPAHKRRRSHVHFDPSLMFKSTTIRYSMALSEPRRKRRHTFVAGIPNSREARHLLHLTPVRRSTRKNRNGPGLTLDRSMCFDSPSEAKGLEECGEVEIVQNRALILSESKAFNTDRADN